MNFEFVEALGGLVRSARSADGLQEALLRAAFEMRFDHFALSLEIGCGSESGASILLHNYPAAWADVYTSFNLAASDPVRRAGEHSLIGFRWAEMPDLIPITRGERAMFDIGRRHGIADGFTVPRHLPGEVTASCSFVTGLDRSLPTDMLMAAELLGGFAIERARRISGWVPPVSAPKLTDRQRECVLWSARGKSTGKIAEMLRISRATVITHLKAAHERYEVPKQTSLVVAALYDGLISFSDIFRWREDH
ncbi:autoinducer binding domain-containing protein [Sphingomonas sp. MMSM20]|uniref:helix-turn-helix transcriptional regulator n=1 Tax=Sphingomonas lycopersici TaxID=2951807 RepID=UPI0022374E66|nr:autoinducer binding domain-containing protein [Sphingomonas lycopersici]MCW6530691.1 autoinducer binding domain-containing protein [Sphingomonas lycopersici]